MSIIKKTYFLSVYKSDFLKRVVVIASLGTPMLAYAQNPPPSAAAQKLGEVLNRLINYSLGFLVILAVALIVYTAFMFMTAGGNSENVQKAKRYLTYIMIGVAVALLSKVFVGLIFEVADKPLPPDF